MKSILIVDDEDFFRDRLVRAFARRGYRAAGAADHGAAMTIIRSERPDLGVFDLKMPGKSGLDLLRDALGAHPEMEIIVLTGYGSIATAIDAVKAGALSYLAKPADVDDLLAAFARESTRAAAAPAPGEFTAPSLARTEWEHINRVLNDCGGNITAAAKRLDIHRRTLQRKLRKYPPRK